MIKHSRVLITGASNGIGEACAKAFAKAGTHVLLAARSADKIEKLAQSLAAEFGVEAYPLVLDVRDYQAVQKALTSLPDTWKNIDILVNNAGCALGLDKIQDGDVAQWEQMIDTNVKGLLYMTREVLGGMLARNQGYIVNIGSISSHHVYSGGVVYCATKFAERAISEGIKMDVHGTPIRVTSIDPGMVKTEFSNVRFSGDTSRAQAVYEGVEPLIADDIADAILYCVTRPPHVNIREMKIYPTDQTATHMTYRRDS